ncbi:MAG: 1-deoxy-D-xylulose-5-phosphate synthase [Candidatus Dormibacteraceae bacterium]
MGELESITEPSQIREFDAPRLERLAAEIRAFLVEHISRTGGHLGPNLGVVELTLALHRVFVSPKDAIVWDTGHQAYVHKLLTGRSSGFDTLRRQGGLSGYPNRAESEHDLIENSHASTSLSYALGLAQSRLRSGVGGMVVAVIGDGALTGGMAYEALNQISHLQPPNLIIVLNDNGRSYAPTVGGMARHLDQLRVDPRYERLKAEISQRLRELPGVGGRADQAAYRIKESIKQLLQPSTMFETLGLKYAGPVDGHDLAATEDLLRRARRLGQPTVIHVVTEKGRGYAPALDDETDRLHGVSAFDPLTGRPLESQLSYTDTFGEALMEAGARHPELVAITAAMASSTGMLDFAREFPDRFYDVGICEQHAVTFAAGLAMAGSRPVVAIYSTFLQRAFDQVITDVALHRLPVVFALDRAGITGPDGPSHHGVFDLSYLRLIPNLKICAPADATELCALLETALAQDGPVAIRFPRGPVPGKPDLPAEPIPVGRWEEISAGEPGGPAILAIGRMVEIARAAAGRLDAQGISCAVINARWLKPMDPRLVSLWAKRYSVLITAEDNVVSGGFGSAVLEILSTQGLAGKVTVAGLPDAFTAHGSPHQLLQEAGLDPVGLAQRVVAALSARSLV